MSDVDRHEDRRTNETAPRVASRPAIAAAAAGGAVLADAAIETFVAGSVARWWAIGIAVTCLGVVIAIWRSRMSRGAVVAVSAVGVLALIVIPAWLPGGLTDGIRLAGQPTARLIAVAVAAGIVVAGLVVSRAKLPRAVRVAAALLAAYGVAAFVTGAIENVPLTALLSGQSLWSRLPRVLQGAFVGGLILLPIGLVWSVVTAGLRRPARASLRAEAWRMAALATSLALVAAALPARSRMSSAAGAPDLRSPESIAQLLGLDPNAPKLSPAELNAALANSFRAIEDGERETPRDHWDLAYVANALGNDPQRIFAWVRDNTFWVPYRGLLRGSAGVLMDRLGNSLDRAALLAMLLRQTGQPVRLAHGSLSPGHAAEHVRAVLRARYVPRSPAGMEAGRDDLKVVAGQYALDERSLRRTFSAQAGFAVRTHTRLQQRIPDQTERLTAALGSRPPDRSSAEFARAIEAAQDHWWVQFLDGSGAWQDFDLAASSAGTTLTTAQETVEIETFPDELRHRITVRVIAEQWADGGFAEAVALQHALTPAQQLGVPIVLRFMPGKWPANFPPPNMTREGALRAFALEQHEWTPALAVGKQSEVQNAIHDTGDVAPPRDPAQELGETTGGKMGGLAKRLDDAFGPPTLPHDPSGPSKVLTAVWIEYEIHQPGEQPQKIRRTLFDLVGPAARATRPGTAPQLDETALLTRSLALMRETEILPIVCRFVPEYPIHLWAQSLLANRDLIAEVARGDGVDDFAHTQDVAKKLASLPSRLYGLAVARFEWSRLGDAIFLDKPNILTRHTFIAPRSNSFTLVAATDIVANDVGVDLIADDAFAVRLEQGIFDTNAEAVVASDQADASNAGSAFASSTNWTTLRGLDEAQLAALRLPDDVRSRIAGELSAGYVVVAPTEAVTIGTGTFSGWWRVNPATGHTLGLGSTGWGQDMVEYLVIVAIDMQLAYAICMISGGGNQSCFEQALIWGVISALLNGLPLVVFGAGPAAGLGAAGRAAEGLGEGTRAGANAANELGAGARGGDAAASPLGKTGPGGPGGGAPPGSPGTGPAPPGAPGSGVEYRWSWGKPPSPELQKAIDRLDEIERLMDLNPWSSKLVDEWGKAFREWKKFAPSLPGSGGAAPAGPRGIPAAPTGPGGTQVIPCSGAGCGAAAKVKTGLNGVLNALAQKGGG